MHENQINNYYEQVEQIRLESAKSLSHGKQRKKKSHHQWRSLS